MVTSWLGRSDDSGAFDSGLICLLELVVKMRRWSIVSDSKRSDRMRVNDEIGKSRSRGTERVVGRDKPLIEVRRTLIVEEAILSAMW